MPFHSASGAKREPWVINPLFLPHEVRPDCSQFCRCLFVHVYTMIFKPNHWLVGSPIQLGLHFGRNINASNLLIVDKEPDYFVNHTKTFIAPQHGIEPRTK